jgi:hypothetical protein
MPLTKKQQQGLDEERLKQDLEDAKYRARGITVGTAFGGTTEITMRGPGASFLYSLMQPVEVVELIHQLSANIGCHIHITPRKDFASWRDWKVSDAELSHARGVQLLQGVGWPPFVNDMAPHMQIGGNLPSPEKQPGFALRHPKEKENVATKKADNKRSVKRTRPAPK